MGSSPHEIEPPWRLGVVSYLNAKPLVYGLDTDSDVVITYAVPARLPQMLEDSAVDAALVPVVDMVAPRRRWQIVSDACIGCDGETLTVRVFSRCPPEAIRTLHVDGESHTSVVLAKLIWRERYGITLDVRPYREDESPDAHGAILLIGDKVVTNTLIDFDVETDLGQAWKSMTSLPFVFAAWAVPCGLDAGRLAQRLSRARDEGVRVAEWIAADFGPGLGFPVALAKRYLTARIKFTLGPRQREGMAMFLSLAKQHDMISADQDLIFA